MTMARTGVRKLIWGIKSFHKRYTYFFCYKMFLMNSKRKGHCARYQTYIKHAFAVCETISFSVFSFYANNINSLNCIKGQQSSKFKCTYNLAPLDSLSILTKLNLLASLLLEVSVTELHWHNLSSASFLLG